MGISSQTSTMITDTQFHCSLSVLGCMETIDSSWDKLVYNALHHSYFKVIYSRPEFPLSMSASILVIIIRGAVHFESRLSANALYYDDGTIAYNIIYIVLYIGVSSVSGVTINVSWQLTVCVYWYSLYSLNGCQLNLQLTILS